MTILLTMLHNLSPELCNLTQRRALSADAVSKGQIVGVLQPPGRITGLTGPISYAHEGSAVVKQLTTDLQCIIDLREPSLLSRGRKHEVRLSQLCVNLLSCSHVQSICNPYLTNSPAVYVADLHCSCQTLQIPVLTTLFGTDLTGRIACSSPAISLSNGNRTQTCHLTGTWHERIDAQWHTGDKENLWTAHPYATRNGCGTSFQAWFRAIQSASTLQELIILTVACHDHRLLLCGVQVQVVRF